MTFGELPCSSKWGDRLRAKRQRLLFVFRLAPFREDAKRILVYVVDVLPSGVHAYTQYTYARYLLPTMVGREYGNEILVNKNIILQKCYFICLVSIYACLPIRPDRMLFVRYQDVCYCRALASKGSNTVEQAGCHYRGEKAPKRSFVEIPYDLLKR